MSLIRDTEINQSKTESQESVFIENKITTDSVENSLSTKTVPITRAEKTSWAMPDILQPAHMVTMVSQVDATRLELIREHARKNGEVVPSYTSLVIKAAALTLKLYPESNRAILGFPLFKKLYQFQNTNISVAVEKSLPGLPGQAYASIIQNTLRKSLGEITSDLQELAHCNESNNEGFRMFMQILKFVPRPFSLWMINAPHWFPNLWSKYRGCACWVNAPSKAGADIVTTTWPWPITFSFGVVKKRPVVIDDRVQARLTMPVVMVFDRRIMGGGPAGRIFAEFKNILENGFQNYQ
ncbi:MAG: 2-oxo acid dehydrogenase subunit E2 [Bdellovibrionales bacterium]|jgi:pyruvate/2-oxoglutarate dehydrogenase complex dihydrolipoamide acyltransferase (E2) component|nr:2-oxo acid dehydrogenase subunit E2 [Bdellovibrionales bacterium]